MRVCNECGFPVKFASYFDWRSDGTIIGTDRMKMKTQIVFLDAGETEELFADLSDAIGYPVDHILIEAEKNVGKAFYANTPLRLLKYAPHNRFMRPEWVAKASVRVVRTEVAGLGAGLLSADSYHGGRSMVLRIENPCFVPTMVGNSLGIYESIERMDGSDYDYGMEDGDLVIWMRHSEHPEKPEAQARLYLDEVVPGRGNLVYDRCETCGVPRLAAATFEWHLEQGMIINRIARNREFIGNVQSMKAMMRELVEELGEEVKERLYESESRRARDRLSEGNPKDIEEFWDSYLQEMGLRGFGYPRRFRRDGDSLKVDIDNAYTNTLYAARLAGALEAVTGRDTTIEWTASEPDDAQFTVNAV